MVVLLYVHPRTISILGWSELREAKCFVFFSSRPFFRPEAFYPFLIALWDRPDQSDGLDPSCVLLLAGLWRCALKGASHSSSNSSKGYSDRPDSEWPPRTAFFVVVVVVVARDSFRGASAQGLLKSQWDGPKIPVELAVALSLGVSEQIQMLSQDWGTFQRSEPKYCEGKTLAFLFPSFKHAHKLTMQINNLETQNIELLVQPLSQSPSGTRHAFWSALNESGPQSLRVWQS